MRRSRPSQVPALDEHRARAERQDRVGGPTHVLAASSTGGRRAPPPRGGSASRARRAAGSALAGRRRRPRPAAGARAWTRRPGRRRGSGCRVSATASATASTIAAFASIPVFAASTPMSVATARIWSRHGRRRQRLVRRDARVFCTVTAVIARHAEHAEHEKVLRSAWIPAPPPESLPAIVSARGRGARSALTRSDPIPSARAASRRPSSRRRRRRPSIDDVADGGERHTEALSSSRRAPCRGLGVGQRRRAARSPRRRRARPAERRAAASRPAPTRARPAPRRRSPRTGATGRAQARRRRRSSRVAPRCASDCGLADPRGRARAAARMRVALDRRSTDCAGARSARRSPRRRRAEGPVTTTRSPGRRARRA